MKTKDVFSVLFMIIITGLVVKTAVPLPVSERQKEAQRQVICQSNLKRIAMAVQMYINDYDDKLPSSVLCSSSPTGPSQNEIIEFLTGKKLSSIASGTKPTSFTQIIWPQIEDYNCLICPSDIARSRVSYWWKYAVDIAWRDPNIQAYTLANYNYSSNQILLYEHSGLHSGDAAGIKNAVVISVAYMDGHVSTITIKNGPMDYPPASDERSGAAAVRLGAPMYFNYDNNTNQPHSGVADFIDPRRYSDVY